MKSVRLGRSGLQVTRITLGTMTFGGQCDEATSHAILDTALELGVRFIDTADVYPLGGDLNTAGRTEEIIGRWLQKAPGRRHGVLIATKAFGKMGELPWERGSSRKHLLHAIDASLKRLQTDHVDLYQLHRDDPHTPIEETLDALDTIVRSGRARYIGVSNFLAWRLMRMIDVAEARRFIAPVSIQPRYSLLFREIERELLPLAHEAGLGVIPYNPLAGGLLTAKHRSVSEPVPGSRFTFGSLARQRYWNEPNFDTVQALRQAVLEAGLSMTSTAVAWVLANPEITSAIVGASRPEQLAETVAGAELVLPADLKARLDEITAAYRQGDAGI